MWRVDKQVCVGILMVMNKKQDTKKQKKPFTMGDLHKKHGAGPCDNPDMPVWDWLEANGFPAGARLFKRIYG